MRNAILGAILIFSLDVFASPKVIAEVFSYPFKPVTVNVVHYRILESGEGQAVVVRPDGIEETPEVLIQLAPQRLKALLNTIELVKKSALLSNPSKESSTCKSNNGFAEYHIVNQKAESILIAKRDGCTWFDVDQMSAKLIELTLDGLPPLSYLRNEEL